MRKVFTALLIQISAMLLVSPALAQEAMTLDQKVNETFAMVTGPFVSLIFAPIPGTSW